MQKSILLIILGVIVLASCQDYSSVRVGKSRGPTTQKEEQILLQSNRQTYTENIKFDPFTGEAALLYKVQNDDVTAMNITFFTDSRCNDGLVYSAEVYINYCEEPEHCQKTLHPRSAVYYLEACLGERSGFIYIPEFPDDDDDYIEIRLCFQEVYEFSYEVKADITEFFEVEQQEESSNWWIWLLLLLLVIVAVVAILFFCKKKKDEENKEEQKELINK